MKGSVQFLLSSAIALVLSSGFAHPQSDVKAAGGRAETLRTVYVVDFRQNRPLPSFGDMSKIAATQARLSIAALGEFEVVPRAEDPPAPCGYPVGQPPQPEAKAQKVAPPKEKEVYYLVHGSFDVRSNDVGLEYVLFKAENCQYQALLHRSEAFPERDLLPYLGVMADALTSRLEEDFAPLLTVGFKNSTLAAEGTKERKIGDTLGNFVLFSLKRTGDYQALDLNKEVVKTAPEYLVECQLKFYHSRNLLRGLPLDMVEAHFVVVDAHGTRFTPEDAQGSVENLTDFYQKGAQTVVNAVNFFRYAPPQALTENFNQSTSKALFAAIDRSMCTETVPRSGCRPQYKAAIALLARLTEKEPTNPEPFELMGQAQTALGDDLDAALAFSRAQKLTPNTSPEDSIRLLRQAGDAWYRARNYRNAADCYADCLRVADQKGASMAASTRAEIRLLQARSLRLAGQPIDALEVILGSASTLRESAELRAELRQLIADMRGADLSEAVKRLELARASLPDKSVLAFAYDRLGGEEFEAAKTQEDFEVARGNLQAAIDLNPADPSVIMDAQGYLAAYSYRRRDFASMDSHLRQAEAVLTDSTPPYVKGWLIRLRALWYRDGKGDWDQAEKQLLKAIEAAPFDINRLELARTYYYQAEQLPKDSDTAKKLLNKARQGAATLVAERFEDADYLFQEASHLSGNDKDSRKLFEEIISKNPKDISALSSVVFICNEYLLDNDCALKYVRLLDEAGIAPDAYSSLLDIAEIEVLNGLYEDASKRLEQVLSGSSLTDPLRAVALFYEMWAGLGQNNQDKAQAARRQWLQAIENMRRNDKTSTWVFNGADHALDGDKSLPQDTKQDMHAMIAAMTDNQRPLPHFPPN